MVNRTEFIRFRVTPEEKRFVENKAAIARRQVSAFARDCVLDKEVIVQPGLEDVVTQLRRIGNNLNQLTAAAQSNNIQVFSLGEMKQEVQAVWQSVNSRLPNHR